MNDALTGTERGCATCAYRERHGRWEDLCRQYTSQYSITEPTGRVIVTLPVPLTITQARADDGKCGSGATGWKPRWRSRLWRWIRGREPFEARSRNTFLTNLVQCSQCQEWVPVMYRLGGSTGGEVYKSAHDGCDLTTADIQLLLSPRAVVRPFLVPVDTAR